MSVVPQAQDSQIQAADGLNGVLVALRRLSGEKMAVCRSQIGPGKQRLLQHMAAALLLGHAFKLRDGKYARLLHTQLSRVAQMRKLLIERRHRPPGSQRQHGVRLSFQQPADLLRGLPAAVLPAANNRFHSVNLDNSPENRA